MALYLHADLAAEPCFLCCSPFRRTSYLGGAEEPQTPRSARWHCKIDCAKWGKINRGTFSFLRKQTGDFFSPSPKRLLLLPQTARCLLCLFICLCQSSSADEVILGRKLSVTRLSLSLWPLVRLWYGYESASFATWKPFFLPAPCSIYGSSVVFSSCVQFSFDPRYALSSKRRENYFLFTLPCAQPRKAKMVICTISS